MPGIIRTRETSNPGSLIGLTGWKEVPTRCLKLEAESLCILGEHKVVQVEVHEGGTIAYDLIKLAQLPHILGIDCRIIV